MKILENTNTIISILGGLLTIVMFFLTLRQKNKCVQIQKDIDNKIKLIYKDSSITSQDEFNIHKVDTLDNRKSIK